MGLIGAKPSKEQLAAVAVPPPTTGLIGKYPGIAEYLSATRWEDGTSRTPSTLTLFIEDGRCKVALNDRTLSRSSYATGESFEACFKSIESHLQALDTDWRAWKGRK